MAHELPIFNVLENLKIHTAYYTKHHLTSLISLIPYNFLRSPTALICYSLKRLFNKKAPAPVLLFLIFQHNYSIRYCCTLFHRTFLLSYKHKNEKIVCVFLLLIPQFSHGSVFPYGGNLTSCQGSYQEKDFML